MLYLVAVVYLANMCGLCTVDYQVSPLSHILCKYGFNDILSLAPPLHHPAGGIEIATYSPWSISPTFKPTSDRLRLSLRVGNC